MSFWSTSSGKQLTGDEKDSFNSGFSPIPDGTVVEAMIKSFELDEHEEYGTKYKIRWKIVEGEFKNREVSQNIAAFDSDGDKKDKALNMMMRIYKLCKHQLQHTNAPTNDDLSVMQGNILTIKIGLIESKLDGKSINFVSEVHAAPHESFRSELESALTRNSPGSKSSEDVPF